VFPFVKTVTIKTRSLGRAVSGKEKGDLAALYGVNRGTHTQLNAYHTIGAWGTEGDDVGLIQTTKAPKLEEPKGPTRETLKVSRVEHRL
jgi:hypothetical protein